MTLIIMCRLDSLQVTDSRRWISLTIVWRQHWIQRVTHHFYQHLYAVRTRQEWMMMKVIYLKKRVKSEWKAVTGILVTPAQRWQVRWVEEKVWGFHAHQPQTFSQWTSEIEWFLWLSKVFPSLHALTYLKLLFMEIMESEDIISDILQYAAL